jgi:hypothetical protein
MMRFGKAHCAANPFQGCSMRMFAFGAIAAFGIVGFAGPSFATVSADPTTPVATAAPASPSSNPDEVICRMSPATTGSRLGGGRECHTQHEWEAMRRQAQENLSNQQMQGQTMRPPGS